MRDYATTLLARAIWVITAALDLASGALSVVAFRDLHPGFDTSSTSYDTGLQGIEDRLAALDSELAITSAPGRGTSVTGRLPAGAREGGSP